MSNIVVDTNVFVHSCNPENDLFSDSLEFIDRLKKSTFVLYVDEGMNIEESLNGSRIWSEYLEHIPQMTPASELLTDLLMSKRIMDISTKVDVHINKYINQNVIDKSDRVFVKVAKNSRSKSLVSHDFVAFPERVRKKLNKDRIANVVVCSEEAFDSHS